MRSKKKIEESLRKVYRAYDPTDGIGDAALLSLTELLSKLIGNGEWASQ